MARHKAGGEPPARTRQRQIRTRSHFKADNPELLEKDLSRTLASLGLFAAHTTGDGNCLFRALADQYYGDPRLHAQVRSDICDYLEAHATYFQNYVLDCTDDDLSAHFAAHVAGMRQLGTYGDDMELTAFSKMTGREIRVVQPGLVYVVADHSPAALTKRTRQPPADPPNEPLPVSPLSARDRRRLAREAKGKQKEVPGDSDASDSRPGSAQSGFSTHALWIVYHAYEHYSSARNVSGPFTGLPMTEPRVPVDAGSDSTPSLTDDSDDSSSDSPSADERLLLQSLPAGSQYATLSAARALIQRHEGSWELALEAAIAEAHGERKRSASPTLPEGSSPRQRLREDSDEDSSDETEEEPPPLPIEPERPRSRRGSAHLAPPSSRETRAQMRERRLKQQSQRVTRSKANAHDVSEGIRTLRV